MEAIGAAASVIQIATTALQSVRFIYDVVNDVKNGPHSLQKLADSCQHLRPLLGNIKAVAERCDGLSKDSLDSLCIRFIKPLLEECTTKLELFEQSIKKLNADSDTKGWRKARLHAKTFMCETKLYEMANTVEHYVRLFGTHLGSIGVYETVLTTTKSTL